MVRRRVAKQSCAGIYVPTSEFGNEARTRVLQARSCCPSRSASPRLCERIVHSGADFGYPLETGREFATLGGNFALPVGVPAVQPSLLPGAKPV